MAIKPNSRTKYIEIFFEFYNKRLEIFLYRPDVKVNMDLFSSYGDLKSLLLKAFSCLHKFYVKMKTFMSSLKDLLMNI